MKSIVGGRSLQVRPSHSRDLADVSTLLTGITGRTIEEPAKGLLAVPVEDERALTKVVRDLDERAIAVAELSLKLPSLEREGLSSVDRRKFDTFRFHPLRVSNDLETRVCARSGSVLYSVTRQRSS